MTGFANTRRSWKSRLCGTIASAAIHAIAEDGHQITVSERNARHASTLAEAYENVSIADYQGVVDASDVIFLGLMAEVAPDILGALKFRDDQRIVTFMAAATLDEADAMVGPARAVAIMMPFPGISKGGTPIMMQGGGGGCGGLRRGNLRTGDDAQVLVWDARCAVAFWQVGKGAGYGRA